MVFGVIVYAYGFDVTNVNLDEIKSETRQTQLVRVLRALARPALSRAMTRFASDRWITSMTIVLIYIDLDVQILPDVIDIPGIAIGLVIVLVPAGRHRRNLEIAAGLFAFVMAHRVART